MSRTLKAAFYVLSAVVSLSLMVNLSDAAPTLWNGNGDNTNWSDPSNWSAGAPIVSSDVQFNSTVNNSNTVMNFGNVNIASYEQPRTGGNHQFNLGTSTLTTGDFSLASEFSQSSGGSANLTVNGSVGGLLQINGKLSMSQGRGRSASLTINPNVTMQVGASPAARGEISLIESTSTSHAANTATVTPGSTFNGYLTNLYVGGEITDLNGDANQSTATLNLSNVTSGVVDVSQNFLVGDGHAMSGTMTISDHVDVKIGVNNANRATLRVASLGGKKESFTPSTLTFGAGSLQAYLSELSVAHVTRISTYANSDNYSGTGTLDASNISSGFIDVAGAVRVGTVVTGDRTNAATGVLLPNDPNYAPNAIGTLRLGAIDVSSFSLQVGDEDNRILRNAVAGNIGRGTLELGGTRFEVRDSVIVDGFDTANRGLVTIEVEGQASGLILGSGATLAVGEGLIDITFLAPEEEFGGDFFGLSWEGNHEAELIGLGSKLTWDDSALTGAGFDAVSVYFRNGTTFVGLYIPPIPEPGTGLLLGMGMLLLMKRRRRS